MTYGLRFRKPRIPTPNLLSHSTRSDGVLSIYYTPSSSRAISPPTTDNQQSSPRHGRHPLTAIDCSRISRNLSGITFLWQRKKLFTAR